LLRRERGVVSLSFEAGLIVKSFDMPWTRRQFVRRGSAAAMAAALPADLVRKHALPFGALNADVQARATERAGLADVDTVRALALRAIDAAQQAGATYADVRVTRTVSENFIGAGLYLDFETLEIGVRALVHGAWGFAASPYWVLDEAAQLGHDAVAQAKFNARVGPGNVDMGTYPAVTGSWTTPIRIDPFKISIEEKTDFVVSFSGLFPTHIRDWEVSGGLENMGFSRQERATATTDGTYVTQTLYQSGGEFDLVLYEMANGSRTGTYQQVPGRGIRQAGAGWELLLDAKLREQIPSLIDEAEALLLLPHKPVEIGRYDVVCDAVTMANLIDTTLGTATQIDRALGYEANAGGTSYLGPDPLTRLGTTMLGSSLLTVHGDRNMPTGLATVQWDDEGVTPEPFPILSQGQLVDYQTTREQAGWLAPWYRQQNQPVRSHGCAWASSALHAPLQSAPNQRMTPGHANIGFDHLVADVKKGLAIMHGSASADFQARNGSGRGFVREIVNGKLGAVVDGVNFLFDAMKLWTTLSALGGPGSQEVVPAGERKGQPAQATSHSVAAVPGSLKDIIIVDARRKS
jgi:TldD protein